MAELVEGRDAMGAPVPNENGVYLSPDEVLTIPDAGRMPAAQIRLLQVPEYGWIYATSYTIPSLGGGSSPLMTVGIPDGLDRAAALKGGIAEVERMIGTKNDAHRVVKAIREWLASLSLGEPPARRIPRPGPAKLPRPPQMELFA